MSRTDKARKRDRAAWLALAVIMAVTALLGVMRVIGGTGGWDGVAVPVVFGAGCAFMFRWTGQEHSFTKGKKSSKRS